VKQWVLSLAPKFVIILGYFPLFWARSIGVLLGYVAWLLQGRSARITQINIMQCFPHLSKRECQKLSRLSLVETAKTALEAAQIWAKPHSWLESKIVSAINQPLVDEAVKVGKGLIFLSPHLGNWEVVGPYIATRWGLTAMYAPSKNPELDTLVLASREKSGSHLVPTSLKGVMAQIKVLKQGGCIGLLPDQVPESNGGIYAPFYNLSALTVTLVHKLIERTGCRVIMVCAKRVPTGFKMIFSEPDPQIYSEDELESVSALNRSVEACIDNSVEQYQWEYKRFKKQPEGVQNLY